MNLSDVYSEIEARLAKIPKLNIPPVEAEALTPDAALLSLPEERNYLGSYGGQLEEHTIELTVCISKNAMRAATMRALEYTDPAGPRSIAQAISSGPGKEYAACDEVTVASSKFVYIEVGGTEYLGAQFTVHVAGSGG